MWFDNISAFWSSDQRSQLSLLPCENKILSLEKGYITFIQIKGKLSKTSESTTVKDSDD